MPVVVATTKAILDGSYNGHRAQSTAQVFGLDLTGLSSDRYTLQRLVPAEVMDMITSCNPHRRIHRCGFIQEQDTRTCDLPPSQPVPAFARAEFDAEYFTGIQWIIHDPLFVARDVCTRAVDDADTDPSWDDDVYDDDDEDGEGRISTNPYWEHVHSAPVPPPAPHNPQPSVPRNPSPP